jgi:hypothetical protein
MAAGESLIELAEASLLAAEELGLSATGLVARIYTCVECDDLDEACKCLDELDRLINEARAAAGSPKRVS